MTKKALIKPNKPMPPLPASPRERREVLADACETVAARALYVFDEALAAGELNPNSLPIAIGVMMDKATILRGEPSSIHRIESAPRTDTLDALLDAMPVVHVVPEAQKPLSEPQSAETTGQS